MNLINKIILFIGATLAGFAVAFKLGSNHEENKNNEETLKYARKSKNIREENNLLTRDQLIDKL